MKIIGGEIIEGNSINDFFLGCDIGILLSRLDNDYYIEERATCKIYTIDNAKFWINKSNIIYQITVFGDYQGKFKNLIGIGSTLKQLKEFGDLQYDLDVYVLPKYQGICFELNDDEDYDDYEDYDDWLLKSKIGYISIYL